MLCSMLRCGRRLAFFAAAVFVSALLPAAETKKNAGTKPADSQREQVEFFAAIESGRIDVKFYPRDSRQARLVVTNKTNQPLSIAMPEAFAAVPALAQLGVPNAPGRNNASRPGKEPQPLGTSSPWGSGNPFGNRMGNGQGNGMPPFQRALFNVEPEKVGQMKLRCVCLAYGKPEPNAHVPYQVKPLGAVTAKPGVYELCALLGNQEIGQASIQAAAWNLANDMTWSRLGKIQWRGPLLGMEPRFTPGQIKEGQRLAEKAVIAAKQRQKTPSSERVSQN